MEPTPLLEGDGYSMKQSATNPMRERERKALAYSMKSENDVERNLSINFHTSLLDPAQHLHFLSMPPCRSSVDREPYYR